MTMKSILPEIVFVDANVDYVQQLLDGVRHHHDVHLISADTDGVAQITQILAAYTANGITHRSIHIVSHGVPGTLYLGNTELSLTTLTRYADQLQTWFSAAEAELLLYGCHVAAGDAGTEFLSKLHALTQAQIAASTTLVGNSARGGNWQLDATTHNQPVELAIAPDVRAHYASVLSGVLYYSEDDNGNGLYILDTNTAAATNIGESGVTNTTVGLAPGPDANTLFGSQFADLLSIAADGSGSTNLGGESSEALAYDPNTDTLYAQINGDFFSMDPATGARIATLAAPDGDAEGLAYGNGVVYGLLAGGLLRVYDIGTDTWSDIGDTGIDFDNHGLAYDPSPQILYALNEDGFLYSVNPTTAQSTFIGDTGIDEGGGLAFLLIQRLDPLFDGFDPLQYLASHSDLRTAFGSNTALATGHYEQFGLIEGRSDDLFDEVRYLASNGDLINAFGSDFTAATQHYVDFGATEGRPTDSFDPVDYLNNNPDLQTAFGNNLFAATEHYILFGFGEGRSAAGSGNFDGRLDDVIGFDPVQYLASHDDLITAFGLNPAAAVQHYNNFGQIEERPADLFDEVRYLASNDDLITAFGFNLATATEHFVTFGAAEGRPTNSFDPVSYLDNNADLQAAFGNNLSAAAQHYIQFGFAEGRPV